MHKPLDAGFLRLFSETRGFTLGRPVNPKITPDGNTVLFLRSGPKSPRRALYSFDVRTGATTELLTGESLLKGVEESLTPEEKARRERMRVSAGGLADYIPDEEYNRLIVPLSGKLFIFDRRDGKSRELPIPPGTLLDPKWSPNGKLVSYVRNHDLYLFDFESNKESAVTTGGTAVKTNGLAEFVAQEEMARFTGYWWSPDSKFMAFEEADHDGVETWFVADPSKPDQAPLRQYYPRPGKANVRVRLGIVPITGGSPKWVEWDRAKYEYLASVRWDKTGPLTIQVQDRRQQELVLLKVSPNTGKTEQLLIEKDVAFTNIRQDFPRWMPNGKFAWVSEMPPGPGLELRFPDGKLSDIVVPYDAGLISVAFVDPLHDEVGFVASKDPTEAHAFIGPTPPQPRRPGSETAVRLGSGAGLESIVFSENRQTFVLTQTTPNGMPRSYVHTREKRIAELPSVAVEPDFVPRATIERLGGADGLDTCIVRPHNFDPKKKYPVVVDVYGGPHHLHVPKAMRNWLVPQWLADRGFIVVAIENRGTPGRGRDWERAIYRQFGSVPIDDQVRGLKLLAEKHPEIDIDRVGMIGWSFGGYMSALSVLKRPDVFKAAVAGAPVTDWEDYDTHYTERYMGILPEDRAAYDAASLLRMAPKLERPLLLVHGTADDNVYYRHTLRLSDALLRADRKFEVLPLPGITHMVTADPVVFERYMTRAEAFFRAHLGAKE